MTRRPRRGVTDARGVSAAKPNRSLFLFARAPEERRRDDGRNEPGGAIHNTRASGSRAVYHFSMSLKRSETFLFVALLLLTAGIRTAAGAEDFLLQILHASDFEGSVAALDDAPRFSSVLGALEAQHPTNTLIVSSGDNYIAGPFYTASADPSAPYNGVKGRADIQILNAFGVQASAFGNHEFDDNTAQVKSLIKSDSAVSYPGTRFPYLSANLDCRTDGSLSNLVVAEGQPWTAISNRIARSAVVVVAGERIGLVGATTPDLARITSPGSVTVATNLVLEIQSAVDALAADGINKIVLLGHLQQLTNEWALAGQLTNVDVIIAGGSHTLLAKPTDRLRTGDVREGDYPILLTSASGEPVYMVNNKGSYQYVGRLVVTFDANGIITGLDPTSGVFATDEQGVIDTGSRAPDPAVTNIVSILGAIIDGKDSNCFGRTEFYLNGLRQNVRTEETNLGDLLCDAMLWYARLFDTNTCVCIRNGGSIRDSIGAVVGAGNNVRRVPPLANPRVGKKSGQVSQLDIENAIRFNNGLALLTITAQGLRDSLEWGVAGSGTPGQFPQLSGVWMAVNPTNPPMTYTFDSSNHITGIATTGSRLRSLVIERSDSYLDLVVEDGQMVGDTNRLFRIVALSFTAIGGDNYYPLTFGEDLVYLYDTNAPNTFSTTGLEQQVLSAYLAYVGSFRCDDVGPELDERNQNLSWRQDTVLSPTLLSLVPGAGGFVLESTTLNGKDYVAQYADRVDGPWMDLPGGAIPGDGYAAAVAGLSTGRFYRVQSSK